MKPRKEAGNGFYDQAFWDCYHGLNYPEAWIAQGRTYAPDKAYVISHPTWYQGRLPEIPDISIYQLFRKSAKAHARETAVIFFDRKTTYGELDAMVGRYAALLTDLGVKPGDVVATMLPNSLQHIVAFLGASRIGAVHTPVNVMYKADEAAYQIEDSGATTAVILDLLYDTLKPLHETGVLRNIIVTNLKDFAAPDAVISDSIKPLFDIPKAPVPGTIDLVEALEKQTALPPQPHTVAGSDTAFILYTAGTTGRAKGVVSTHRNLVFNTLTHTHAFRNWDREINFSIMPMFHTAGYFLHLLPTLYQGGTVIPIPMFDLEECFRTIHTWGVNVLFAPPTLFTAMLSKQELLDRYPLTTLTTAVGCGAPVPVAIQEEWHGWTGTLLVNGWGMTETNSGGIMSIPGLKEKSDAIGVPVFAEVKIVDQEGFILPRNAPGEICYRGLQVAKRYLNKPEDTEKAFLPDGWFKTGDCGFLDDDDFVHFVDRLKDLIVASGYNIAPCEIENVLYKHPDVVEAAVVGVPDDYRGETVKAFIALTPQAKGNITQQEIIDFCKTQLATFKVPRAVEFMDALPKSGVGKILRRKLKQTLK